MKKQGLLILAIVICLFACVFTACDTHEHTCQFGEWIVTKQPTCTEVGQQERSCSCGEKQTSSLAVIGHDEIQHAAQAPTCTAVGWDAYVTCSRCDYSTYNEIPATGHTDGQWIVDNEPSCTTDGSKHQICAICEATIKTEFIDVHGHTEGEVVVENNENATCTEDGSYDNVVYCTVCEAELSRETITVDALDHDEIEHVAQEPTCTDFGWYAYVTCSRCDYSTYVEIPANGHTWQWIIDKDATVTQSGLKHEECSVCNAKQNENTIIDILVCSHEGTLVHHTKVNATCTEDGTIEYWHCTACGKDYLDAAGQNIAESLTISSAGNHNFYQSDTCDGCGQNIVNVAVDFYDMSATTSDSVIGYIVPRQDGKYDAYVKGTGAIKKYTDTNSPFKIGYTIVNAYICNGVTKINKDSFSNCNSITSITISDSVTSIGEGAFSGCSALQSITIPFVGDSRKTEGDSYQYPFGYIFGTSQYEGGVATTQYYYGSLTSSTTLSTYYIPTSLKSVTVTGKYISAYALNGCSNLTSITIGEGVTKIGPSAFNGCSSLTSIVIPNSVTKIDRYSFYQCSSLTSVVIPDSVTAIGNYAFRECSSLTDVYYTGTKEQWNNVVIDSSNYNLTDATIHYNYVEDEN